MTMSQPDALAELRARRPVAPAEVRERIRLIATAEPTPSRGFGFTWRRAGLVLAPALVAVVAATVAIRGSGPDATRQLEPAVTIATPPTAPSDTQGQALAPRTKSTETVPAPSSSRVQDYFAYLRLRVRDGSAVSDTAKQAVAMARSLGGFASTVDVRTSGEEGEAEIKLRVPIGKVQEAVTRLSAFGTIVDEQFRVQDLTAEVNAVDRQIARLQRRLRELRALPQTDDVKRRIESVTKAVERLQRGKSTTVRNASLATVTLQLTTQEAEVTPKPPSDSRLDGACTALGWIGIAALYAVIVGAPFAILAGLGWSGWRVNRRRAEARLLART